MPVARVSGIRRRTIYPRGKETSSTETEEVFDWNVCFRSSENPDPLVAIPKKGWCRAQQHWIKPNTEAYQLSPNDFVCKRHYLDLPTYNMIVEGRLKAHGAPSQKDIISIENIEIIKRT